MALTLNNAGFYRAVYNLSQVSTQLALSNQRLSTGKRVNRAADDPAAIIAAASFDQQLAQIDAAAKRAMRPRRLRPFSSIAGMTLTSASLCLFASLMGP